MEVCADYKASWRRFEGMSTEGNGNDEVAAENSFCSQAKATDDSDRRKWCGQSRFLTMRAITQNFERASILSKSMVEEGLFVGKVAICMKGVKRAQTVFIRRYATSNRVFYLRDCSGKKVISKRFGLERIRKTLVSSMGVSVNTAVVAEEIYIIIIAGVQSMTYRDDRGGLNDEAWRPVAEAIMIAQIIYCLISNGGLSGSSSITHGYQGKGVRRRRIAGCVVPEGATVKVLEQVEEIPALMAEFLTYTELQNDNMKHAWQKGKSQNHFILSIIYPYCFIKRVFICPTLFLQRGCNFNESRHLRGSFLSTSIVKGFYSIGRIRQWCRQVLEGSPIRQYSIKGLIYGGGR